MPRRKQYNDDVGYGDDRAESGYDDQTYDDEDTYQSGRESYQMPRGSYRDDEEEYSDDDESYEDDNYDDEYDESYYDDENVNGYEYRHDEAAEERAIRRRRKRDERDSSLGKKVVAAICCCCICLITILVLILVLVVFKQEDTGGNGNIPGGNGPTTPKPTPRPTYPVPPALKPANMGRPDIFKPWERETDSPTISPYPTSVASSNPTKAPTKTPTPKPTISPAPTRPVPPSLELLGVKDTYVFVDGFDQYEAFGNDDFFLVQNGLEEYYEFGDSIGLIAFDLSEMPKPVQLMGRNPQAILKLTHLPLKHEEFLGREPSTINIRRLVSTPMRIETIHGGMINKEPAGSVLGKNSFTVTTTQTAVQVDVTDLLFPPEFQTVGYDKNQFFIMLVNNGVEQGDKDLTALREAGDRFASHYRNDGINNPGPRLQIIF